MKKNQSTTAIVRRAIESGFITLDTLFTSVVTHRVDMGLLKACLSVRPDWVNARVPNVNDYLSHTSMPQCNDYTGITLIGAAAAAQEDDVQELLVSLDAYVSKILSVRVWAIDEYVEHYLGLSDVTAKVRQYSSCKNEDKVSVSSHPEEDNIEECK